MKIKNTFLLSFAIVAAMVSVVACRHSSSSAIQQSAHHYSIARSTPQLVLGVNFGHTPPDGGICTGKGICDAVIMPGKPIDAVADTFQVSPSDSNVLTMRFSMLNLEKIQPDQVAYFTDTSGTYTFDTSYDLTNPIYKTLLLQPNARIDNTCKNAVNINGDLVTVSYTYLHS